MHGKNCEYAPNVQAVYDTHRFRFLSKGKIKFREYLWKSYMLPNDWLKLKPLKKYVNLGTRNKPFRVGLKNNIFFIL